MNDFPLTINVLKHYIIFSRPNHSILQIVRAPDMLSAIKKYLLETESGLIFGESGSVIERLGRKAITYPHVIAYLEAAYKSRFEWQIREVPDNAWEMNCTNLFCGENPTDIEELLKACRPVFNSEYPRLRTRMFVWYLCEGALVTFYRRRRDNIEVLARYLVKGYSEITSWSGSYDAVLNNLWGPQPIVEGL